MLYRLASLDDSEVLKDKRITVDVLCQNEVGVAFWRAMGFTDYCLTLEIYPDLRTRNALAL